MSEALGDLCVISLFSDDGPLVPVAVRATDTSTEQAVRQAFPIVPLDDDDPYLIGRVASTSCPAQVRGENETLAVSSWPELAELLRATGAGSLLVVPMRCAMEVPIARHGDVVGVVVMMRRASSGYSDGEVSLLQDVADRSGLVLGNARLHSVVDASERRFRTALETMLEGFDIFSAVARCRRQDRRLPLRVRRTRPPAVSTRCRRRNWSDGCCARRSREPALTGQLDQWVKVVETGEPVACDAMVITDKWGGQRPEACAFDNRAAKLGDGFALSFRDVTERVRAAEALATSEERFRSTFDHSPAGLAIASLETNDRGRIHRVNPAMCDLTGFDHAQLVQMTLEHILLGYPSDAGADHPASLDGVTSSEQLVSELLSDNERRLCRCRRADGQSLWAQVSVTELPGDPRQCLVQVDDVTAQKLAEEDLAQRALHDQLTGLANRNLAMDHLRLALKQLARQKGAVAVFYLDLDHFKQINDTFGHEAGDDTLRQVGARLAAVVRAPDTAARLGGDEFVVVCAVPDEDSVQHIVERLQASLVAPVVAVGKPVQVNASIGVAVTSYASADPGELLRHADAALYEAKRRGRHRWQAYNEVLHSRAGQRHTVELDLRRAIDEELFKLYYQPIFDLGNGRVVGAEALLRLAHPRRGLLQPGSFIEVAEDSDLIIPIGDWVLHEACSQVVSWQPPAGFQLAVNISAREMNDLAVTNRALDATTEAGIDPSKLLLEMTEGALIEGGPSIVRELSRLREAGVGLAIDDFGTGYGSLSYLRRFPVDTIKIDRSFIAGLGENADDSAIVEAVTALSHSLKLTAIAEGVERPGQIFLLRELGCPRARVSCSVPRSLPGTSLCSSRATATGPSVSGTTTSSEQHICQIQGTGRRIPGRLGPEARRPAGSFWPTWTWPRRSAWPWSCRDLTGRAGVWTGYG